VNKFNVIINGEIIKEDVKFKKEQGNQHWGRG
jgi:predicted RNA-binding protein